MFIKEIKQEVSIYAPLSGRRAPPADTAHLTGRPPRLHASTAVRRRTVMRTVLSRLSL